MSKTYRGSGLGSLLLGLCFSALVTSGAAADAARGRSGERPAPRAARPVKPSLAQTAEQGLELYRRNRSSLEAQRLLSQASIRLPERHDVHLALLDSYLACGNVKAATALLQRLTPELASSERLAFDAVYYLLQHRQLTPAQEQSNRLHEQILARQRTAPGSVATKEIGEDLFVQGLLAAAARQKDEAMRLLHMADGHDFPPLDSRQMLILADTLYELREDGLAAPTYREYLQHWPDDRQARVHYAVSLEACSQPRMAQEELERVLREDPRFPEANFSLGSVLFDQKRHDEAKARFEQELKLDPRCYQCMAKLAHIAYLGGDDQSCQAWLQKAAALNPTWAETNLVYGMLEIRAGQYESAIRHLTRVVDELPDHAQAHFQLAVAYQRSGNAEKAAEHADIFKKLTQAQEQKALTIGQPR